MGLLDKLFGRDEPVHPRQSPSAGVTSSSADEVAIDRYRYMLQTAPPHTLEQAHAEAFAKLTPEQRTRLLQQLSLELPEAERAVTPGSRPNDDPKSLARLATRAEIRQPGTLERSFSGMGAKGGGMGGMLAGSFMASMAGVVIGSAIAQSFFSDAGAGDPAASDAAALDSSSEGDTNLADSGDAGEGDFDVGGFDEV
jgi:hypothetical protein